MFALLALHLAVGVLVVALGDRPGRRAFLIVGIAPLTTLVWAATRAGSILDGEPVLAEVTWVERLGLGLDLRLDAFGLVMTTLVSGIGLLVCIYAYGYFSHPKPGSVRLAGLMTLFGGAMLGVVWADHLLALFVAWELTSVTSYLLIGNDDRNPRARAAALQAILITGAGGLAMLVGLIVIGQAAGTYRLSELLADPPTPDGLTGAAVAGGLVCVLLGAFTKSAQVPFGSWLPGAMVAPTPISAYLHSATMVKAGVYLVARLSPIVAGLGHWRLLVLTVGAVTMIIGGLRALRQTDLKLLLAHGTVSQLGFLMVLFGTGQYRIAQAGVVLLLAHGAFKAALFMVVGIVDHQVGTRDVRELHGFGRGWTPTLGVGIVAAASMAGLPPLFGFIAKEKALAGYADAEGLAGSAIVLVAIVVASTLTFAYSARFVLALLGRFGDERVERPSRTAPAPSVAFVGPAVVLAAATVTIGLAPAIVDRLVRSATAALHPGTSPSRVVLWAGFDTAFVLSLVIIAAGGLLTVFRRPVARAQRRTSRALSWVPTSEQGFLFLLRSTLNGSKRITAIVQHGSLPIYLAVIMTVAVVAPLVPAVGVFPSLPVLVDHPIQIPLAVLVVTAAVGAAVVRRRLSAALMLGAVGYGMAGLFIVQGAPDLALTQLVIETLATVLFVLVLRFLPARWADRSPAIATPLRLSVSLAVGVTVFVLALVASAARTSVEAPNISQAMIERSAPEAKGDNVVNVILVDFRGLDTLGEITVLVVAAVGAVTLARSGRRATRRDDQPDGRFDDEHDDRHDGLDVVGPADAVDAVGDAVDGVSS